MTFKSPVPLGFSFLMFLMGAWLAVWCVTTASATALCHELEPFLVQTLPQASAQLLETAIAKSSTGGRVNVSCLLVPGRGVAVLLGSSSVHLLSPLRGPPRAMTSGDAGGEVPYGGRRMFVSRYWRSWAKGFQAYAWRDPAAIERFFFRRHISLRFRPSSVETTTAADTHLSASELLTIAGLQSVRVTSFTPSVIDVRIQGEEEPRDCTRHGCGKGREAEDGDTAGADRPPSPPLPQRRLTCSLVYGGGPVRGSADAGVLPEGETFAFEEVGPYRGGSLWIPSWLSAWLGRRPMATISEKVAYDRKGRPVFLLDAEAPIVKPICLCFSVVKNNNLILELEETSVFDLFWCKLMAVFLLLLFLKPWVEEIPALQIFIAGLGSVTLLTVVIVLYALKRLQNMTIGRVGLIAIATLGGTALLAETFLSAVVALYYSFVHHDSETEVFVYGGTALLIFGLSCGMLSRRYCASYLTELTRWTLRLLQLGVLLCAIMQNREATMTGFMAAFLFYPPRMLRLIQWFSSSSSLVNNENEPQETFPNEALHEVRYVRPLCIEGRFGRASTLNPKQRLEFYRMSGNEYTHRALEELAQRVNNDPGQYASKLSDPDSVVDWARGYGYT